MIDHKNIKIEELHAIMKQTMAGHLGMEVTELGADFVEMRMPVSEKTVQPWGTLDGGASMALAETAASLGANLVTAGKKRCLGLDINGNHLKAVRSGFVIARATPLHTGKRTQVWEIMIRDESGDLVCAARMTLVALETEAT